MIHFFHWETIHPPRLESTKQLVEGIFSPGIQGTFDNVSTSFSEINGLLPKVEVNDTIVFLAHFSNLSSSANFLSIIRALNEQYPQMLIIIYSGGRIEFNNNEKKVVLYTSGKSKEFGFSPINEFNIYVVSLEGYNYNKDFAQSINLKEALNVLVNTGLKEPFFKTLQVGKISLDDFVQSRKILIKHNLIRRLREKTKKKIIFIADVLQSENNAKEDNIFSDREITKLKKNKKLLNELDALIVVPELECDTKKNDFRGFEIASELRKLHKLKAPIVFLSTYSLTDFENFYQSSDNHTINILFAPSSYLVEFDLRAGEAALAQNLISVLNNSRPLHSATLLDINNMLLNVAGELIDRFTHTLSIKKTEGDLREVFRYAQKLIPKDNVYLSDIENKILRAKVSKDSDSFNLHRNSLIQFLENTSSLTAQYSTGAELGGFERLKVVVIEDNEDYQQLLKEHLANRFDLKIFGVGMDAVNYLRNEDKAMQVGCVISDWRLFKKGSANVWQDMQGYEALSEVAHFHTASLVSLTSEIDKNVHAIRNSLGITIHIFKKQYFESLNVENKLWEMFGDTIEDLCLQALTIVSSQPTGSSWTVENSKNKFVSLKAKYLQKRMAEWPTFEKQLSQKANEYWIYYKAALTDVNPYLESIEHRFGLKLGDNLENILIVRRLWLALWFEKNRIDFIGRILSREMPEINIYIILKSIDLDEEKMNERRNPPKAKKIPLDAEYIPEWKKKLENNATAFCSSLCITPTDLPSFGLLPEEKKWLLSNGIHFDANTSDFYSADE